MKHCDRGMRSIVTIIAFLSKGINCFDMDIVMLPISTIKAVFYSAVRQAGNGAHSWWCFDSISLKVWGHRSHSAIYSIDTASSQLWPDITLLYPNGSEYFQRCKETEAGREDGIESVLNQELGGEAHISSEDWSGLGKFISTTGLAVSAVSLFTCWGIGKQNALV